MGSANTLSHLAKDEEASDTGAMGASGQEGGETETSPV